MSVQYSDSPAREVPGYWLGDPSAGLRWWFDAEFRAWRTAGTLYLPVLLILWLAVPLGALMVGVLAVLRQRATPYLPEDTYALRGRVRGIYPDLLMATLGLLVLLLTPVRMLLTPMPFLLAVPAALIAVIAITKRVMPYLDNNRPFGYWAATLSRIAGGPRPRRARIEVATTVAVDDDGSSHLTDYHLLGLSAEVTVKRYRPITATVEAMRWEPRDLEAAGQVAGWLQSRGVGFRIDRDKWLIIGAGEHAVLVQPGYFVVRMPDGSFDAMSPRAFAGTYEETA